MFKLFVDDTGDLRFGGIFFGRRGGTTHHEGMLSRVNAKKPINKVGGGLVKSGGGGGAVVVGDCRREKGPCNLQHQTKSPFPSLSEGVE